MADFVAVLKKTIEGLSENTPERREKIYAKARATIEAKLASLQPPPPAAVAARQKQAIEDAIEAVEAQYAPPPAPADDGLDDFFAAFSAEPSASDPTPVQQDAERAAPALPRADPFDDTYSDRQPDPVFADGPERDGIVEDDRDEPAPVHADRDDNDFDHRREREGEDASLEADPRADDPVPAAGPRPAGLRQTPETRRRVGLRAAAAGLALLVLAGGAYAVWVNQDTRNEVAGTGKAQPADPVTPAEVAEGTDIPDEAALAAEQVAVEPEAEADSDTEIAALSPEDGQADADAAPVAGAAQPVQKFTQRLQPDGTEVDEGPAGGAASIGEGTSVAELTREAEALQEAAQDDPASSPAAGATPAAPGPVQDNAAAAVPVGQRAIFYEERTSTEAATADSGSIVWTLVQESPGNNAPPEPAIRAEATIPAKDIQLRMTIRRNTDPTLPAGHIMEMIFLTPDGFAGGGIQNVVRVALKETEEATGSPLLGIPARIADGFFLVALSDSPAEVQANLNLLGRQNWIDVPLVYNSGRRALITMEKGIPGERVFEEALRAWRDTSNSG